MKTRTIFLAAALLLCGAGAFAQEEDPAAAAARYKTSYERQVRNVGLSGLGVETIIDKWEIVAPDDPEMLSARFNFLLDKSRSTNMVVKDAQKYLGKAPLLVLKDSSGRDVNYFEEQVFVDSLFAAALKMADRAVKIAPYELRYRFNKLSALLAYEKDDPQQTAQSVLELVKNYTSSKSSPWTLDGAALDEELFCQAIGEYCYSFFQIGSPSSYARFREVATRMNKLYPKNTVFINDLGSYWQVAEGNNKKALRYYKKALKIDPEDYVALNNIRIIQLSQSRKGRPSK